jgi:hypothetical protein
MRTFMGLNLRVYKCLRKKDLGVCRAHCSKDVREQARTCRFKLGLMFDNLYPSLIHEDLVCLYTNYIIQSKSKKH